MHINKKRKRTEEEKDYSVTTSTNTANVSTLWSRLDRQNVAEISVGLEDPKTVQEATGVNPKHLSRSKIVKFTTHSRYIFVNKKFY